MNAELLAACDTWHRAGSEASIQTCVVVTPTLHRHHYGDPFQGFQLRIHSLAYCKCGILFSGHLSWPPFSNHIEAEPVWRRTAGHVHLTVAHCRRKTGISWSEQQASLWSILESMLQWIHYKYLTHERILLAITIGHWVHCPVSIHSPTVHL